LSGRERERGERERERERGDQHKHWAMPGVCDQEQGRWNLLGGIGWTLVSLNLRRKDLIGPVMRVKKKNLIVD